MHQRIRRILRGIFKRTILLGVSLSFVFLSSSLKAEEAILRVFLNTDEKGDYFFLLKEGEILVRDEDLLSLGFKEEIVDRAERIDSLIILKLLCTDLRIDKEEASLYITTDPRLLKETRFDLTLRGPTLYPTLRYNSLYLNYRLGYSIPEDRGKGYLSGGCDLSTRLFDTLLYSTFSYHNERVVRLNTNITKDLEGRMLRIRLGDVQASSGRLGGTASILGLEIGREFSFDPDFIRHPLPSFSYVIERPSKIEVYLGDRLLKKGKVLSGELKLLNLPLLSQREVLRLVIRDEKGVREISTPLYYSPILLRPGLHDFSYSLGIRRRIGLDEYRGVVGALSHRIGVSEKSTLSLGTEAEEGMININLGISRLLPFGGVITLGGAVSRSDGAFGSGSFVDYWNDFGWLNLGARFKTHTSLYANLSTKPLDDKARSAWSLNLGTSLGRFGWVSGSISYLDKYHKGERKMASLNYGKRLGPMKLDLRAARIEEGRRIDNEFWGGLSLYLGGNKHLGYRRNIRDDFSMETVSFEMLPDLGLGLGAQLDKHSGRTDTYSGRLNIGYRGTYGNYGLRYNKGSGPGQYNLSLEGAVSFIGDLTPYLSRPIYDSFALIEVNGLKGVRVYRGGSLVGRTDRRGRCIVPGLTSYHPNRLGLGIEGEELKIEYTIKEYEKYVSPPYKGGVKVVFEVKKFRSVVGRLLMADGRPIELTALTIYGPEELKVPVGRDGEFYIEDLPPGRYSARVFKGDRELSFEIIIPESDEMVIDLGGICIVEKNLCK